MREADQVGRDRRHQIISVEDVEDALAAQRYRSDRVERRMREQVLRETIRIATDGEAVGQVNGLAVLQTGSHAFGRPTRLSPPVRVGPRRARAIAREAETGGPPRPHRLLHLPLSLAGT